MAYLGPAGSFTHAAAEEWIRGRAHAAVPGGTPADSDALAAEPSSSAAEVLASVGSGRAAFGVVAWENNVEGPVVPVLDALIELGDVAGIDSVVVDIAFDAFVRPDHGELTEVVAHPHGLAQCRAFGRREGLASVSASSNAAACRDVGRHQVALGPAICGRLYGLKTYARSVQDFSGARTQFLVVTARERAGRVLAVSRDVPRRTILAFIAAQTGPGVLADILEVLRAAGLNLSSIVTRPIKAEVGKYTFVVTFDAAPWDDVAQRVLRRLLDRGEWLKVLGVYPASGQIDSRIPPDALPAGWVGGRDDSGSVSRGLLWE